MDTIKNLIIDGMNGMSLSVIPFFIFQLLTAAFLGWYIQLLLNKKLKKTEFSYGTVISFAVCLTSALTKYVLPFSVLGAAAILILLRNDKNPPIYQFLVIIIGVGCGIGSVIPTAISVVILSLILLFTPLKETNE